MTQPDQETLAVTQEVRHAAATLVANPTQYPLSDYNLIQCGHADDHPLIEFLEAFRLASIAAVEAERELDRADAERWRALISSDRFKAMGSAGFTHSGADVAVNPDSDYGWLHFGLEVWDKHPAADDAQGVHGRNLLLAYVEHRRAALASTEGERG